MNDYLKNCTEPKVFYLRAFSSLADIEKVLFTGILLMYPLTVLGNVIITALVCLAPQLHTPMYFFLCNLSIQDIIYVSATLPKFLSLSVTNNHVISFTGCITQIFLFASSCATETFLLASMAYDRYVAICIPMHYTRIMSTEACAIMASVSWLIGILNSLMLSLLMSGLAFCASHYINHFFCDLKTMMKVSSGDTTSFQTLLLVVCVLCGFFPVLLILISYVCIISAIVKIRTSTGRAKAFSSCSSHLTVVFLFYGTSLSFYVKPQSEDSQEQDKLFSLLYTAVIPMLNPLVYSLRNQDVLKSMKSIIRKYSGKDIHNTRLQKGHCLRHN
ncbi:olfactory receptor 1G1-like [Spea bombifrons]|uniref:olfactory receptor 1G1-like n=1 Tax=Spea bombifrons TaxID=233779 RepID=UPI00234AE77D|nr:olfactory receptor 1G1-like [Spea bombifrons]